MARKPYPNTALSTTRRCKECSRFLKLNLLAKNPDADLCYRCWRPKELRRRGVSTGYIRKKHPTSSAGTMRERRIAPVNNR